MGFMVPVADRWQRRKTDGGSLKIDGIPGESNDDKHKNEIDVLSFSFGISRHKERGRPNIADFTIVKRVDTASPLLFAAACQGDPLKGASFTSRKAGKGQQEYLIITMQEVIVTSVEPSGAPGTESLPMESLRLDFRSMEMEVFRQNPDGSLGGSTKTDCVSRGGSGRRSEGRAVTGYQAPGTARDSRGGGPRASTPATPRARGDLATRGPPSRPRQNEVGDAICRPPHPRPRIAATIRQKPWP